ncbi:MAG: M48 family metalloprotease [Amylibacter sp.]|jgi:predicted Zn-dependent protease|nr:M48 family metalloprotease [Amylibacter sp.]
MSFKCLLLVPIVIVSLAACTQTTSPVEQPKSTAKAAKFPKARSFEDGKSSFTRVSKNILPLAKQACRTVHKSKANSKCNFRILIKVENGATPDARFSRTPSGRTVISFNSAMLQFLRDDDETAMVLAHEMSHQIADHIERGEREVLRAAIASAAAAKKAGTNPKLAAQKAAETTFIALSRKFELEADRAGTVLMMRAGYNPEKAINLLDRQPVNNTRFRRHPLHPERKQAVHLVAKKFRSAQRKGKTLALAF